MKTRHFIILGIILLLLGLIYIPILKKEKTPKKKPKTSKTIFVPVLNAKNKIRTEKLEAYGQIRPNLQLDVVFEVQGKLKKGLRTLKPGVSFRKGEILYSVERVEQLYSIFARRTAFQALITSILPDLELDFNSERKKWESFALNISEEKSLPKLPAFNSDKEKRFISSRNILSEYYAIKSQETRLDKYFYVAPFSGSIVTIFAEPGSMVNPGTRIASLIKTNDYEVKVPIQKKDITTFKNAKSLSFINPDGEKIGEGKLLRVAELINQSTQSIDAYFSISAVNGNKIYQGDFVNLITEADVKKKSVSLPMAAVQENKIQYLKENKVINQEINITGKKGDSVFISGIDDDTQIILSPINNVVDSLIYKGVEK